MLAIPDNFEVEARKMGFKSEETLTLIDPSCNLATLQDGRGGVFTWADLPKLDEINLIITRAGENRGFHYHTEFREWVMVVEGEGVYMRWTPENEPRFGGDGQFPFTKMGPGNLIHFPMGAPHTLVALTDIKILAMLDKRWDDCENPITRIDQLPHMEKL